MGGSGLDCVDCVSVLGFLRFVVDIRGTDGVWCVCGRGATKRKGPDMTEILAPTPTFELAEAYARLASEERSACEWAEPTRSRLWPSTEHLADATKTAAGGGDTEAFTAAYVEWDSSRQDRAMKVAKAEAQRGVDAAVEWESDGEFLSECGQSRPEETDDSATKGFRIDWGSRTVTGWAMAHGTEDDWPVSECVAGF